MIIRRNHAKLFLEGIEVPFLSATVNVPINEFPTMSFTLPPTARSIDMDYRTLAHLLVWVAEVNDYVVLFEGEVTQRGYSFSPGTANATYTAMAMFNHLGHMDMLFEDYRNISSQSLFRMGVTPVSAASDNTLLGALGMDNSGSMSNLLSGILTVIRHGYTNESPFYKSPFSGVPPTFFKGRGETMKLTPGDRAGGGRYAIVNSDMADAMLLTQIAIATFKNLLAAANGTMSRWQFIVNAASLLMYDIVMPTNMLKNGFIFKPQGFFSAPPKCNVMFPNTLSGFSYNENFYREPSRVVGVASALPLGDSGSSLAAQGAIFAPGPDGASLEDQLVAAYNTPEGKSISKYPETAYEARYGVMQYVSSLQTDYVNQAIMQALQESTTSAKEFQSEAVTGLNDIMHTMLEVEYYKARHESKTGSFNGGFNPFIVPGYSGMVLKGLHDPTQHDPSKLIAFVGYVAGVSHSIDPVGGYMSTSGYLTHARPVTDETPSFPSWVRGSNIENSYKQILGCDAVGSSGNLLAAARAAYSGYINSDPTGQAGVNYAATYNNRYMATLQDLKSFHGVACSEVAPYNKENNVPTLELTGAIFNDAQRKARVQKFADELKKSNVILGV